MNGEHQEEFVGKYTQKKPHYILHILKSIPFTVLIFALIGLVFPNVFQLNMDKNVWFYFFSSVPQIFSALTALFAVFFIFYLERINTNNKNMDYKKMDFLFKKGKDLINIALKFSILIIISSLILLPFGSVVSTKYEFLKDIMFYIKLDWIAVFSMIGLCIAVLIKIYLQSMDIVDSTFEFLESDNKPPRTCPKS